jgi:hypothetical protein
MNGSRQSGSSAPGSWSVHGGAARPLQIAASVLALIGAVTIGSAPGRADPDSGAVVQPASPQAAPPSRAVHPRPAERKRQRRTTATKAEPEQKTPPPAEAGTRLEILPPGEPFSLWEGGRDLPLPKFSEPGSAGASLDPVLRPKSSSDGPPPDLGRSDGPALAPVIRNPDPVDPTRSNEAIKYKRFELQLRAPF